MKTPDHVLIQRITGKWELIEIVPVLREERRELVTTGSYQLYFGFPEVERIEDFDDEVGYFLGELHFHGIAHFEWRYEGTQLNEIEVEQVVNLIQHFNS